MLSALKIMKNWRQVHWVYNNYTLMPVPSLH